MGVYISLRHTEQNTEQSSFAHFPHSCWRVIFCAASASTVPPLAEAARVKGGRSYSRSGGWTLDGGRPLGGGTAGLTAPSPRCGLSLSTETASTRPSTSTKANFSQCFFTIYGPLYWSAKGGTAPPLLMYTCVAAWRAAGGAAATCE